MLGYYLAKSGISLHKLSVLSGVPYSTLNELYNHKSSVGNCKADTIYRICGVLNVSMEKYIKESEDERIDYENFKSNVCQRAKKDEIAYIIEILETDKISVYMYKKWYFEGLYLLAMLDYLSKKNEIPLCDKYDYLRTVKFEEPVYPRGILILSSIAGDQVLEKARKEAIPEFIRHNIIEAEVENVA